MSVGYSAMLSVYLRLDLGDVIIARNIYVKSSTWVNGVRSQTGVPS